MLRADASPRVTLIASGFASLEAPMVGDDGSLYVSDLRAGGVHRLRPDGGRDVLVPERLGIGGLCRHASGGIIMSGPSVAHVDGNATRVLLGLDDLPARPGTVANGFNDMTVDQRGRVLVGVLRRSEAGEPVPGEVVRISAAGAYDVLHTDIFPNGMAFSADGTLLFAADTYRRRLRVFDTHGGHLAPVTDLPTTDVPGLPDGVAADAEGGLWVAFYRGGCIARFGPRTAAVRTIAIPARKPLSLCFAGPGSRELYVVTGRSEPDAEDSGRIYRLSVGVKGVALHAATV